MIRAVAVTRNLLPLGTAALIALPLLSYPAVSLTAPAWAAGAGSSEAKPVTPIGQFESVHASVFRIASGKQPTAHPAAAESFTPLTEGDRIRLAPGAAAEIVFYATGLRYRLTLPAKAKSSESVWVVAPGDLGRAEPGTQLVRQPLRALSQRLRAYLPGASDRFNPAGGTVVIRDPDKTAARRARRGDAVSDPHVGLAVSWSGVTSSTGTSCVLSLSEPNSSATPIWEGRLTPDAPVATIPPGTLSEGKTYVWVVRNVGGEDGTSGLPTASGAIHVLAADQHTVLEGLLAEAAALPRGNQDDPMPELLAAGICYDFGLYTASADAYRAAFARRPVPSLNNQVTDLLTRPFTLRPVHEGGSSPNVAKDTTP